MVDFIRNDDHRQIRFKISGYTSPRRICPETAMPSSFRMAYGNVHDPLELMRFFNRVGVRSLSAGVHRHIKVIVIENLVWKFAFPRYSV